MIMFHVDECNSGVHGANRLAGNSLLEVTTFFYADFKENAMRLILCMKQCVVFGKIAAQTVLEGDESRRRHEEF